MSLQHIAIAGCAGRMGRALLEAVAQSTDFRLKSALERSDSPFVGKDSGEIIGVRNGVVISDDVEASLSGCDVLIDFTGVPQWFESRSKNRATKATNRFPATANATVEV